MYAYLYIYIEREREREEREKERPANTARTVRGDAEFGVKLF